MADASTSTSSEESHPYTLETLKQHGTRDDLWMLINGKVYDVTKFLDEVSSDDSGSWLQSSRVWAMTGEAGVVVLPLLYP
jgi:hypothetical protein